MSLRSLAHTHVDLGASPVMLMRFARQMESQKALSVWRSWAFIREWVWDSERVSKREREREGGIEAPERRGETHARKRRVEETGNWFRSDCGCEQNVVVSCRGREDYFASFPYFSLSLFPSRELHSCPTPALWHKCMNIHRYMYISVGVCVCAHMCVLTFIRGGRLSKTLPWETVLRLLFGTSLHAPPPLSLSCSLFPWRSIAQYFSTATCLSKSHRWERGGGGGGVTKTRRELRCIYVYGQITCSKFLFFLNYLDRSVIAPLELLNFLESKCVPLWGTSPYHVISFNLKSIIFYSTWELVSRASRKVHNLYACTVYQELLSYM